MAQSWFVSRNERVYGPWSGDEVLRHKAQGNISDLDFVWGAGQSTWVILANWSPVARASAPAKKAPARAASTETVVMSEETVTRGVSSSDDEVTALRELTPTPSRVWHYASGGKSFGPFTRDALLIELRRLTETEDVSLWTKGMREWAPIAEFHDFMNDLGTNRRAHPRVTVRGQVTLKYDDLVQPTPLISLSAGGVRILCDSILRTGQIVTLDIDAEGLGSALTARAEVRYCTGGVVGLKFEGLAPALRQAITTFVNGHVMSLPEAA